MKNLPVGKFLVSDNAYVSSKQLLTPFSGDEKYAARKGAYNFSLDNCESTRSKQLDLLQLN